MSTSTPIASMALFAVAAVLGAVGQYLYKSGADVADGTIVGYLLNLRILAGVICYVAVMLLFITAFRISRALIDSRAPLSSRIAAASSSRSVVNRRRGSSSARASFWTAWSSAADCPSRQPMSTAQSIPSAACVSL